MKTSKFLLSFVIAAAMTGCVNDADVSAPTGQGPVASGKGNLKIVIDVPNSSNGSRSAEDSGIYDKGTAEEYNVSKVTLYLFDADSKNLVTTLNIAKSDLGTGVASGASNNKEDQTIVYSCNKEYLVKPGNYDILAIANGALTFQGGQVSTLLAQIDASTYGNGLIAEVPSGGFIMSNRGSSSQNISIAAPTNADSKTTVNINLERAIAKLMVRNTEKEAYDLVNPNTNTTYATVRLNNYKFVNLANKFYTFRHVATLENADETPAAPSYSIAGGNFGNIADSNGYLIDPYFFDKTVSGASNFTGGSFYTNHLSKQEDNNWSGLANAGVYVSAYCLENCMFRPAQNTAYTTGIMLKGTFTPRASETIGDNGQPVQDPLTYAVLYYFNYKFYTTLAGVGEFGKANIAGLNESSSDKELDAKQIMRFQKNGSGNFSTFYNYWIRHQDNQSAIYMGVMEFGIVRNNIYAVNINSIKDLGPGTPQKDPTPDEYKALLDVNLGVYPWIVRDQGADLEK